ncbi:MAG: hypothetical protein ACTIJ6_11325 [Leucobacter sp.]
MRWIKWLAAALLAILSLSGCSSTPLVSEDQWGVETRAELQRWTVAELDAAVAASALSSGWVEMEYGSNDGPPLNWDTDRDRIIDAIKSLSCYSGGSAYPQQLYLALAYDDPPHPFEAIESVRAYWQANGWSVTDIYPLESEQSKIMQHAVARKDDGALLSIQGSATALVLSVTSVCSVHGSV